MRRLFQIIFIISIFFSCGRQKSDTLIIAAAANTQFAMEELIQSFEAQSGIPCDLITSSSGKLTAQIKAGAPYDIFISADMKYPTELHKSKLTTNPPQIYAYGQLVLWSLTEKDISFETLTNPSIKHIALANPRTAPYGTTAVEALKNAKLYNKVEEKLIFGESIGQTTQFISTKTAQAGFTAKSIVLSPKLKNQGHWAAIPSEFYQSIQQGAVILNNKNNLAAAQKFYQYLFSEEAKRTLKEYGYLVE